MPRRKVTEPTNIYWLYDTRPEKVAVHGEAGEPFYCGKTVGTIQRRLSDHRSVAKRLPNGTKTCVRINICGDFLSTRLIEIVSLFADWCEREQFWINRLRAINPECTNIAKGGGGAAGNVWTPEQRARLSAIRKGHKHSHKTREKISKGLIGSPHQLIRASRPRSPATRIFSPRLRIRMPRPLNANANHKLLIQTYVILASFENNKDAAEKKPCPARFPKGFEHLAKLSHFERFQYLYD